VAVTVWLRILNPVSLFASSSPEVFLSLGSKTSCGRVPRSFARCGRAYLLLIRRIHKQLVGHVRVRVSQTNMARRYRYDCRFVPAVFVRRLTISLRAVVITTLSVFVLPLLIGFRCAMEHEHRAAPASDDEQGARDRKRELSAKRPASSRHRFIARRCDRRTRRAIGARPGPGSRHGQAPRRRQGQGRWRHAETNAAISNVISTSFTSPEDTFGVLRTLLQGLENRLRNVRKDVERQEALAAATPSIWPAHGWLDRNVWRTVRSVHGEPGFHQGLDISTEKGQPVYGHGRRAGRSGLIYGRLRQT